jgi:hypothetical protein
LASKRFILTFSFGNLQVLEVVAKGSAAIPAEALIDHNYPTEPVPFTDQEGIRTLTDYGLTLLTVHALRYIPCGSLALPQGFSQHKIC